MNIISNKLLHTILGAKRTLVVVLLLLLSLSASQAAVFEKDKNLRISQLQNIDDDLYVLGGEIITIDGSIEGDLTMLACAELVMHGEVKQSANAALVRNVTITGAIQGSFRAFAETVRIGGYIGGSSLIMAKSVIFESESVIERSVDIFAETVTIDGSIKGKADIKADAVIITGLIVGDLTIDADSIIILAPAIIRGNLNYTSDNRAQIDSTSGVTIVGNIDWHKPGESSGHDSESNYFKTFATSLAALLAAFLFGIIMLKLFRPHVEASFIEARDRLSISFATGSVALIGVLASVIILLLSIVLMIIGLDLLGGDFSPIGLMILIVSVLMVPITSFGTLGGGIIFYSGKIVIGFLLGNILQKRFLGESDKLGHRQLIIGLVCLSILFVIPFYVGFLLYLFATIAGAGAIILGIRNCLHSSPIDAVAKPPEQPDLPTSTTQP